MPAPERSGYFPRSRAQPVQGDTDQGSGAKFLSSTMWDLEYTLGSWDYTQPLATFARDKSVVGERTLS